MSSSHAQLRAAPLPADGPPAPLLACSFFLAGLGTVLLGPLLPRLLREWTLTDQQGGLLLLAKFLGAFLGGVSIPARLRLGIFAGHFAAAAGFVAFALSPGLLWGLPALLLAGFGLGQLIASTNILAGRRWSSHRGSALALINLFWSLGAVSTGLLVAALLPHYGWRRPTLALAGLLVVVGLAGFFTRHHSSEVQASPAPDATRPVTLRFFLRFAGLMLLYGGLETCLTAWLSTFTIRFAGGALLGGQSGFVLLWIALTGGRALASAAMRRWPEIKVQRVSLVLCFALVVALSQTHTPLGVSVDSLLLGVALAPVFPSIYGMALSSQPPARVAGLILAVSGLGAALFPWLMGLISTRSGSLRLAMLVPALLIPVMLLLSLWNSESLPE